jgi:hypothetical protein
MPGSVFNAVFNTGGSITVDDTLATAAISAQTAAILAQTLWMTNNLGVTGLKTPGSFISQLSVVADSLNDTTVILSEMLEKQKELVAQLGSIQTSLNAVSTQLASGVTTQQMAVADQIKSNKFQQLNTNAALARADLPPIEVKPADMGESISSAIQDIGAIKIQTTASQLVESNISAGIAWTATQTSNIISESFVGVAAASAKKTIKGWLKIVDPEVVKTQIQKKAAGRAAKTLDAPVVAPP